MRVERIGWKGCAGAGLSTLAHRLVERARAGADFGAGHHARGQRQGGQALTGALIISGDASVTSPPVVCTARCRIAHRHRQGTPADKRAPSIKAASPGRQMALRPLRSLAG